MTTLRSDGKRETVDREGDDLPESLVVVGYGAGRGVIGGMSPPEEYRRLDSLISLFKYNQELLNVETCLGRLEKADSKIFDAFVERLQEITELPAGSKIVLTSRGVTIRGASWRSVDV